MRIMITSVDHARPDDAGSPEVHDSLASLRRTLLIDAGPGGYTDTVLGKIEAGETRFSVPNGPNETDYYDIRQDQ